MTIRRMEHVGIVVDELADAIGFFAELGLELQGEAPVEGAWVDSVVGLEGVRADIALMRTPDGHGRLELVKFHSPAHGEIEDQAPANAPGLRHVSFDVKDIDAVVAGLRARGGELVVKLRSWTRSTMTLLLDTHVWLWMLADPDAFGDLRPVIDDSGTELLLSAASSWEISIKHAIGRLSLPEPATAFVPSRIRATGVT